MGIWSMAKTNVQTDYWVKWEDGVESFVSVGAAKHGPMKELIAEFEADQAKKRVSVVVVYVYQNVYLSWFIFEWIFFSFCYNLQSAVEGANKASDECYRLFPRKFTTKDGRIAIQ